MKKIISGLLSLVLVLSLAACGGKTNEAGTPVAEGSTTETEKSEDTTSTEASDTKLVKNVMFVVTGNLGGGTNNDDVFAAISDFVGTVNGNVDTFECNMDTSLYESTLMQAAETKEYDLIVTGFGTMVEPLANTASKFPEQKFLIFDTIMDFENGINNNVISVQVLQNEGGFLAGALSALMTTSDAELANPEKTVGFVGAIESTSILDFLMGYIDGVNYVDSSIEVKYSFVGDHKDSALAKELGLAQYQQNADVVFACGGNGLGVAEAALDADKYVVGVDFDYATRLESTSPESAAHVLTSVIKDYRGMVYPILESIGDGTAQWGTHSYISYAENGVYLADNDYSKAIIPDSVREEYNKVVEALVNGEATVHTAFGASTEEIEEVKAQAAPF